MRARWWGALILAAALGGCVTPAEQRAADEGRCRSYGFRQGSDPFANCLMALDLDRSATQRARLEASFYGPGFYGPGWYPYRRW